MEEFIDFALTNWGMTFAFLLILIYWIGGELFHWYSGVKPIDAEQATRLYNRESAQFIDIRARREYDKGHLPQAFHMPEAEIEQLLTRLRKQVAEDSPLIVYDESGKEAAKMGRKLRKKGFTKIYRLKRGLNAWVNAGYPLEDVKSKG
ncbi:Rhodanese-related sulfurtransferase [Halorhodospira halochloris]|uniref:Rhodanese-related sulfurtransferase n=1 Tax=Halorhodospira halochloris TaxID=1052 RepID=A0A0X8X6T0_HALHR|nr:rhodanese-like domain-containing protein [Halorhodospira halochloris]MBK1650816.1 sulfurtransferase [Halorhodospira halochloris]BAU56685.1 Rhodanese-related sulfurtransferase [Halorhodospira halochloris]